MSRPAHWNRLRLLAMLVTLGGAACGDPATPPSGLALEVVQRPELGLPGEELPELVIVRVASETGEGVAGIPLQWSVDGGGTVTPQSSETGLDGLATARWRLGPLESRQVLRVSALDGEAVTVAVDAPVLQAELVDAGYGFGCAVRRRELWCFGPGVFYAEGLRSRYDPVRVFPGTEVVALAASDGAVCAADPAGGVLCRGWSFTLSEDNGGVAISGLPPITQLSAGDANFCGLAVDGSAWCWRSPTSVARVPGTVAFRSVSAGGSTLLSACGLDGSGAAWCWGSGREGQLGNGLFEDSETPVPVSGGLRFQDVSAGWIHICGTVAGGVDIYCWGSNGTLGLTPEAPSVAVPTLRTEVRGLVRSGFRGGMALAAGTTAEWDFGPVRLLQDMPGMERLSFREATVDDEMACGLASNGTVVCTVDHGVFDRRWSAIPAPRPD